MVSASCGLNSTPTDSKDDNLLSFLKDTDKCCSLQQRWFISQLSVSITASPRLTPEFYREGFKNLLKADDCSRDWLLDSFLFFNSSPPRKFSNCVRMTQHGRLNKLISASLQNKIGWSITMTTDSTAISVKTNTKKGLFVVFFCLLTNLWGIKTGLLRRHPLSWRRSSSSSSLALALLSLPTTKPKKIKITIKKKKKKQQQLASLEFISNVESREKRKLLDRLGWNQSAEI